MGIFGDIGGAIGGVIRDVGPGLAAAYGQQWIAEQFRPEAPRPQIIYAGGPPGVGAGTSAMVPAGAIPVAQMPQGANGWQRPVLEVPSEVPWGFDEPGIQAGNLFKTVREGRRAVRFITAKNPATGQVVFWEHAGRPVLFSRDLRTCRRVGKIAARAARGRTRRTCRKR